MARHRNIRTLNYDEEYNEYYDEYSRSLDEDLCISPTTANQYLLNTNSIELEYPETIEEDNNETLDCMDDDEKAKLYSCLEAIQDVVGETILEEDIIIAIRKKNYNYEKALDLLLNNTGVENIRPEHNRDKLSNLYLAFTSQTDFTDSNDFNCYNFRTYIKDYFTKSLLLFHKSTVLRDSSNKQVKQQKTPQTKPVVKVESNLKPFPSPDIRRSKTPNAHERTESPVNILKTIKNIKQKRPDEVLLLYKKKLSESKVHLNLVIVGHVDAGKSTIMGHLLSLMGMVSKKNMHKNEVEAKKAGKASFLYAWVLDETEEERKRGITIDIGQYQFETDNRNVTILDAPGHRDFIPNMIAGTTRADVAILVVDATKGEFETGFDSGGQTQEHILLLRSFGISQLAVAINKLDNVEFSEKRYLEIVDKIKKFLKQVGFKDNNTHYIPCSGLTGDNLLHSSKESAFKWYKGDTLVSVIDSFVPNERMVTKPFRMSINDIYKGQTSGICLSGKIDTGYVEISQRLFIKPINELCTVKNIFFENETKSEAFAGDVVILNVLLNEGVDLSIGNVLSDISSPCTLATKFEARIVIFNNIDYPIIKGFSVILYSVCLNETAVLSKLSSLIDKSNKVTKRNPRLLTNNSNAIVEFTCNRPICIETFNDFKDYGRFIFRSGDITIGAGIVTKILL